VTVRREPVSDTTHLFVNGGRVHESPQT
jgi:hypothetical protein